MNDFAAPQPGEVWTCHRDYFTERFEKVIIKEVRQSKWSGEWFVSVLCIDGTEDAFTWNTFVHGFNRIHG